MNIKKNYEVALKVEGSVIEVGVNNEVNIMNLMPLVMQSNINELQTLGNLDLVTLYNIHKL